MNCIEPLKVEVEVNLLIHAIESLNIGASYAENELFGVQERLRHRQSNIFANRIQTDIELMCYVAKELKRVARYDDGN